MTEDGNFGDARIHRNHDPEGFTWSELAGTYRCDECGRLIWTDLEDHKHG